MNDQQILQHLGEIVAFEAEMLSKVELPKDAMLRMVREITACSGTVVITGCGTSGIVAQKIEHTLRCIHRPAVYLNPTEALHGGLGFLRENDIFIAISYGGETDELIKMLPACKQVKCLVCVACASENSTLAKAADVLLKIKVDREAGPHDMFATASTIAVLSVFDSIAMTVALVTDNKRDQFALIHPGGAVGSMLKAEVE